MIKSKSIPQGWSFTDLKNVGEIVTGNTPSMKFPHYYGGNIPWVKPPDINKNSIIYSTPETLSDDGVAKARLLPKGAVLVICIGNIGNVALAGVPLTTNQQINSIIFNSQIIDFKYGFYWCKTLKRWLIENSTSTTISMINKSRFGNAPFLVAPLKEQKRIADKLDKLYLHLDSLNERLDRIPELLKQFRKNVLMQAVTGKLTEGWRINNSSIEHARQFTKNIIAARKREIAAKRNRNLELELDFDLYPYKVPDTWIFSYLENFGELTRGKSKHRPRNDKRLFDHGKYPFIQTGDVARSKGLITAYSSMYSDFGLSQSRLFPAGTLCITIAANIADTGILAFDACFPDSVVGYVSYENLYSAEFAMFYLMTMKDNLEHLAPATAQKNINLQTLSDLPFPVPPLDEQNEIISRVKELFEIIDNIEHRYYRLQRKTEELPSQILSKAFRGELVSQNTEDEPASVLLQKTTQMKTK